MPNKIIFPRKGIATWEKAKRVIPGGNQFLSKRPELYLPGQWPSFYRKAKGVEIWDLDGNKYIDMYSMGIGSCVLGFADHDVNTMVKKAIDTGSMSSLNCEEEISLSQLLCRIHPWAEMARFARTGGEATSIAIRIARAYSGKDKIAFCGYHSWADWYLAANLSDNKNLDGHLLAGLNPIGVPRALKGTVLPFNYNNIKELEKIVSKYKDIGVIMMEPSRHQQPKDQFLQKVRAIANKIGAVLIFDEVTSAWRTNIGGVHLLHKVNPDLAVFGKAMSNGYPMSAIIGKKKFMQVGQDSFISSTYWSERIGPVAALATINKMIDRKVPKHLEKIGKLISNGWEDCARKNGLNISIEGPYAMPAFTFNYGKKSLMIRTLFTQEMLKRGFLATGGIYISLCHTQKHIKAYLKAVDQTFAVIKQAIDKNNVANKLNGPVAHSGFKRLI